MKIIGNPVGTTLPKPDWSQTDPTKGDYIKNKPEIPSKLSQLTNDSGFAKTDEVADKNHKHEYNTIKNRPFYDSRKTNEKVLAKSVMVTRPDTSTKTFTVYVPLDECLNEEQIPINGDSVRFVFIDITNANNGIPIGTITWGVETSCYRDFNATEYKFRGQYIERTKAEVLENNVVKYSVTYVSNAQISDTLMKFHTEVRMYVTGGELKQIDEKFIPEHEHDEYAKKSDIPEGADLTGYATENFVKEYSQPRGNYLTEHQDLSGYAKKTDIPTVPVQSVNSKTGAVQLSASDVGADADGTAQTKVSEHNTSGESHNDIRLLIEGLTTRLNTALNSTDADLDQMAEIVAYIKSNKSLIDGITTNKVSVSDIIDNLTTSVSNKPLSAKQGVELKKLIDAVQIVLNGIKVPTKTSELSNDSGYVAENDIGGTIEITSGEPTKDKTVLTLDPNGGEINIYTAQEIDLMISQLSGGETVIPDYYVTEDELAAKNYLTSIPSEYITESELTSKGYLTQHQDLSAYAKKTDIPSVPTKTSQLTNDSGYLTSVPSEYITETELNAKKYLTAVPSEYVTETELNSKGYLTQHQDLSAYAKISAIPTKVSQLTNDKNYLTVVPGEYVTDSELNAKGYLTAVPSEYVTDSELNNKGYAKQSDVDKITDYSNVSYGTCSTAAATAEKVVTVDNENWELKVGAVVMVNFTTSNSASSVKLNVNGTGAYPIWYNNAEYTSTGTAYTGYANRVIGYMFNGTHWVWIMQSYDSNTTYTNVKLGHGYATCSTAEATTAKVGTLSSYTLTVGGIVAVKFTNAVPANATLNINSKGAKNIFYRGTKIVANVIKAGDIVTFIYDGTQYQLLSIDRWQSDVETLAEEIVDLEDGKVDKTGITLDKHTDGLTYIFVNGKPVGNGFETGNVVEGDVIGTLEENNDILLSGDIADGTYMLKWKNKDGTYTEICPLEVGKIVAYSITQNITNAVSSNLTASVAEGESFTTKITANDGYILSSVIVTMGGVNITSTAVSGGTIAIASVTGDIVITVNAIVKPNNILDGTTLHINQRYSSSGGSYVTLNGYASTEWLDVQNGDVIRINRPISVHKGDNSMIMYKNSGGGYLLSAKRTSLSTPIEEENDGTVTKFTVGTVYKTDGDPSSGTKELEGVAKMYIGLMLSSSAITEDDVADLIITKNEVIA